MASVVLFREFESMPILVWGILSRSHIQNVVDLGVAGSLGVDASQALRCLRCSMLRLEYGEIVIAQLKLEFYEMPSMPSIQSVCTCCRSGGGGRSGAAEEWDLKRKKFTKCQLKRWKKGNTLGHCITFTFPEVNL